MRGLKYRAIVILTGVNNMPSYYLNGYLNQSKAEMEKGYHPKWLREFFESFHDELNKRGKNTNPGNKYVVVGAFSKSLEHLLPPGINPPIKEHKPLEHSPLPGINKEFSDFLKSKRIDFLLEKGAKRVLIEYKTNSQFSDVSAAMVEMHMFMKFLPRQKNGKKDTWTASLHLFPSTPSVAVLRRLNEELGKPLDEIWVLCKEGEKLPVFDIAAIKKFRKDIANYLMP